MHNEVLEDGRQNKLDLTRILKNFTLDLVTEDNPEVCIFLCINKSHSRKTGTQAEKRPKDVVS